MPVVARRALLAIGLVVVMVGRALPADEVGGLAVDGTEAMLITTAPALP